LLNFELNYNFDPSLHYPSIKKNNYEKNITSKYLLVVSGDGSTASTRQINYGKGYRRRWNVFTGSYRFYQRNQQRYKYGC
jgi:hypothetical protein